MLDDPGRDLRRAPDDADGGREPARPARPAPRDSLAAAHLLEAYLAGQAAIEERGDELTTGCADDPFADPDDPAARRARAAPAASARRSGARSEAERQGSGAGASAGGAAVATRRLRRAARRARRRRRRAAAAAAHARARSSGTRTPRAAAEEPSRRSRPRPRRRRAGAADPAPPVAADAPRGPRRRLAAGGGLPRAPSRRHPFRLVGAIVAVLVLWFLFAALPALPRRRLRQGRR